MKLPTYYITDLELDITPNYSGIDFGYTSVEFEVEDNPEYDEEMGALLFQIDIELNLECHPLDFQNTSRAKEEEIGTVQIQIMTVINASEEVLEEYISTWQNSGYESLDYDFRYFVESGIVTEVFSPISNLVSETYRGILPGFGFSEPEKMEDPGVELERQKFVKHYLKDVMTKQSVDLLQDEGIECGEDDIIVSISDEIESIEIEIADDVREQLNDDVSEKLNDLLQNIVKAVLRDELNVIAATDKATERE